MCDLIVSVPDAGLSALNVPPEQAADELRMLAAVKRVIAAHLAGLDLTAVPGPRPQVQRFPTSFRPVSNWIDVLPDVS